MCNEQLKFTLFQSSLMQPNKEKELIKWLFLLLDVQACTESSWSCREEQWTEFSLRHKPSSPCERGGILNSGLANKAIEQLTRSVNHLI